MYDVAVAVSDDIKRLYIDVVIDELEILTMLRGYISKMLNDAKVEVYSSKDEKVPDLGGKKRVALPLRPGIFVE